MLSGYLRPSGGTAFINGIDIKADIDAIRLQLGVCPQENVLWDDLTGPEHLYFFGRLKNLRGKKLDEAVDYWMEQVNLTNAKHKFSRQYSGGMKRRLCVAIAMIGDPAVVLLDEPTTGLDPASKQSLWEVVTRYKRSCAMMLTTHSMEEAEELCDRLGIFVGGRLATIGTAQDLKSRFGSGYRMVITTPPQNEEKARGFVQKIVPKAKLLNTLAGTQQFEVPRGGIKLSKVFQEISSNADKYGIVDWGVSNTTLEEVFLYITDKTEGGITAAGLKALEQPEDESESAHADDSSQILEKHSSVSASKSKESSKAKTSKPGSKGLLASSSDSASSGLNSDSNSSSASAPISYSDSTSKSGSRSGSSDPAPGSSSSS